MENNYNGYGSYNKQKNQYQEEAYKRKGHNHEFQSNADYEKEVQQRLHF